MFVHPVASPIALKENVQNKIHIPFALFLYVSFFMYLKKYPHNPIIIPLATPNNIYPITIPTTMPVSYL